MKNPKSTRNWRTISTNGDLNCQPRGVENERQTKEVTDPRKKTISQKIVEFLESWNTSNPNCGTYLELGQLWIRVFIKKWVPSKKCKKCLCINGTTQQQIIVSRTLKTVQQLVLWFERKTTIPINWKQLHKFLTLHFNICTKTSICYRIITEKATISLRTDRKLLRSNSGKLIKVSMQTHRRCPQAYSKVRHQKNFGQSSGLFKNIGCLNGPARPQRVEKKRQEPWCREHKFESEQAIRTLKTENLGESSYQPHDWKRYSGFFARGSLRKIGHIWKQMIFMNCSKLNVFQLIQIL